MKMVCCRPEGGQSRIPACETFCLGEDEIKLPCVRKRRFLAGLNAIKTFFGGFYVNRLFFPFSLMFVSFWFRARLIFKWMKSKVRKIKLTCK